MDGTTFPRISTNQEINTFGAHPQCTVLVYTICMTLEKHLRGRKVVYLKTKGEHYKIGCCADIAVRYPVKSQRSEVLWVLSVPDEMNVYDAEKMAHRMFSDRNVDGFETFDLLSSDIEKFTRLRYVDGRLEVADADQSVLEVQ